VRRSWSNRARLALIASCVLICAACSSSSSTSSSSSGTATNTGAPVLKPGTYTFGVEAAETGEAAAAVGLPELAGLKLVINAANSSGALGPGVKIALDIKDDGAAEATAIPVVRGFIADPSIVGLICCVLSDATGGVKPLLDAAHMPSIITSAGLVTATTTGSDIFRAYPLETTLQPHLVDAVVKAFNPKSAVVVFDSDNQAGAAQAAAASAEFTKDGVKVSEVQLLSTDTDMTGPATSIIGKAPDVVYQDLLTAQVPSMIAELTNLGYKGKELAIAGLADTSLFKICGKGCVGALAATAYVPSPDNQDAFMKTWLPLAQQATGEQAPSEGFAYGYLAGQFLIDGMKDAAEASPGAALTRASLLAGLHAVKSLPGTPFGPLTMVNDQGIASTITFVQFNAQGEVVTWDGTAAGLDKP
jgi:ABC-type branched-subunit amino acid transport system substrate-binding protein